MPPKSDVEAKAEEKERIDSLLNAETVEAAEEIIFHAPIFNRQFTADISLHYQDIKKHLPEASKQQAFVCLVVFYIAHVAHFYELPSIGSSWLERLSKWEIRGITPEQKEEITKKARLIFEKSRESSNSTIIYEYLLHDLRVILIDSTEKVIFGFLCKQNDIPEEILENIFNSYNEVKQILLNVERAPKKQKTWEFVATSVWAMATEQLIKFCFVVAKRLNVQASKELLELQVGFLTKEAVARIKTEAESYKAITAEPSLELKLQLLSEGLQAILNQYLTSLLSIKLTFDDIRALHTTIFSSFKEQVEVEFFGEKKCVQHLKSIYMQCDLYAFEDRQRLCRIFVAATEAAPEKLSEVRLALMKKIASDKTCVNEEQKVQRYNAVCAATSTVKRFVAVYYDLPVEQAGSAVAVASEPSSEEKSAQQEGIDPKQKALAVRKKLEFQLSLPKEVQLSRKRTFFRETVVTFLKDLEKHLQNTTRRKAEKLEVDLFTGDLLEERDDICKLIYAHARYLEPLVVSLTTIEQQQLYLLRSIRRVEDLMQEIDQSFRTEAAAADQTETTIPTLVQLKFARANLHVWGLMVDVYACLPRAEADAEVLQKQAMIDDAKMQLARFNIMIAEQEYELLEQSVKEICEDLRVHAQPLTEENEYRIQKLEKCLPLVKAAKEKYVSAMVNNAQAQDAKHYEYFFYLATVWDELRSINHLAPTFLQLQGARVEQRCFSLEESESQQKLFQRNQLLEEQYYRFCCFSQGIVPVFIGQSLDPFIPSLERSNFGIAQYRREIEAYGEPIFGSFYSVNDQRRDIQQKVKQALDQIEIVKRKPSFKSDWEIGRLFLMMSLGFMGTRFILHAFDEGWAILPDTKVWESNKCADIYEFPIPYLHAISNPLSDILGELFRRSRVEDLGILSACLVGMPAFLFSVIKGCVRSEFGILDALGIRQLSGGWNYKGVFVYTVTAILCGIGFGIPWSDSADLQNRLMTNSTADCFFPEGGVSGYKASYSYYYLVQRGEVAKVTWLPPELAQLSLADPALPICLGLTKLLTSCLQREVVGDGGKMAAEVASYFMLAIALVIFVGHLIVNREWFNECLIKPFLECFGHNQVHGEARARPGDTNAAAPGQDRKETWGERISRGCSSAVNTLRHCQCTFWRRGTNGGNGAELEESLLSQVLPS